MQKNHKAITALKKLISDATHPITGISFVDLKTKLENCVVRESYLLTFQYSPNAIAGALKDTILHIIGHYGKEMSAVYSLRSFN